MQPTGNPSISPSVTPTLAPLFNPVLCLVDAQCSTRTPAPSPTPLTGLACAEACQRDGFSFSNFRDQGGWVPDRIDELGTTIGPVIDHWVHSQVCFLSRYYYIYITGSTLGGTMCLCTGPVCVCDTSSQSNRYEIWRTSAAVSCLDIIF